MLNYETILSSYDDKMTLMQWLKKVEEALKHASATAFRVSKKGNATISFILDFEDGTTLESGDIVLQQGESVNGAYIENNHLFITLTNGQVIDAGLMFNGDLTINGTLDATKVTGNEIVEKMSGYSFEKSLIVDETIYAGVVKNGNKITFSLFVRFTADGTAKAVGTFNIPSAVGQKIFPTNYGSDTNWVDAKQITASISASEGTPFVARMYKNSNTQFIVNFRTDQLASGTTYVARYEVTFLLSPNLAGN